jgi:hypothetical protein
MEVAMDERFPKVLVVSADSMESATGTGVTLRNLFRDWPSDRLAQLHLTGGGAGGAAVNRFRLPARAVPVDWALRTAISSRRPAFADGAPSIAAVPLGVEASKSARRHADVRALLDLSPVLECRETVRDVANFAPDVVYSLLGSDRVIRIARSVARRTGAPLVPHFMDDWPSTLYSSGELGGLARSVTMKHLANTLAESPVALCISAVMADEYSNRFSIPCEWFVNPVDDILAVPPAPGPPIDMVYVGGLHLGRWQVIEEVARSLLRTAADCTLTVHAPQRDLDLVDVPDPLAAVLRLGGELEPPNVSARLSAAHVLLHVESFDESTRRYTRLSLSTKVPQYLAAGRPMLAVGPPEQASMQMVHVSGAGVVANLAANSIDGAVRQMTDPARRTALGVAGRIFASEHFAGGRVRARLRQVLTRAAGLDSTP